MQKYDAALQAEKQQAQVSDRVMVNSTKGEMRVTPFVPHPELAIISPIEAERARMKEES